MNTASLHATVYLQTKEKEKEKEIQQWNKKATKINNTENSILQLFIPTSSRKFKL